MDYRYPSRGEAVRVVLLTAGIGGLLCVMLAAVVPGRDAAWVLAWTGVVAAVVWNYIAEWRGWPFSRTMAVQAILIGGGLAASWAVVGVFGWLPPVIVFAVAGLSAVLLWFDDDGPGSDLGGPTD